MEDFPVSFLKEDEVSHANPKLSRRSHSYGPIVSLFILLGFVCVGMLRAGQASSNGPKNSAAASHGVDLTIFDKTCKPCEDFYHYASGDWLKKNPVPPAYPSWGR